MIKLSKELNIIVETDFHSTTLRVSPSSKEMDIYNDWKKAIDINTKDLK